jgi:hypothetical protein
MTDKTTLFDAADYLETPEEIAAFLDEALEIGDPRLLRSGAGRRLARQGHDQDRQRRGPISRGALSCIERGWRSAALHAVRRHESARGPAGRDGGRSTGAAAPPGFPAANNPFGYSGFVLALRFLLNSFASNAMDVSTFLHIIIGSFGLGPRKILRSRFFDLDLL